MHAKDVLGRKGESLAADHLIAQGMKVLARNWRCAAGEIDIVALEGSVVVICEVRTRTSDRFGTPLDSVNAAKFARLRSLAMRWLIANDMRGAAVRVDVIGIIHPKHGPIILRHIRGAS